MKSNGDGYVLLAEAIVVQAVKDFRKQVKIIKRNREGTKDAEKKVREIVRFIKSSWFTTLTDLEPSVLLRKLQKEVEQ